MTTNAYFGPNLAASGQNPYFLGVCKRGKPPREKPSTHLVRIVFWSGMEPLGPKLPIFGQICQYLSKNEKPIGFVTQAHNSLYTFRSYYVQGVFFTVSS